MMAKRKSAVSEVPQNPKTRAEIWVRAAYHLHTFSYRDPRTAYASGVGIPVPSPSAVLLGIVSTLFNLGHDREAKLILSGIESLRAIVDPPDGAIFFRAFHQIRRYCSSIMKTERAKYVPPANLGLTIINQSTREYALVQGKMTVFVRTPEEWVDVIALALRHRTHIGSRDSLCSLIGDVDIGIEEPTEVLFLEPEAWQSKTPMNRGPVTVLMLSRFNAPFAEPTVGKHWWLSGGENTELAAYLVQGSFEGTTRGKLYRKKEKQRVEMSPEKQRET